MTCPARQAGSVVVPLVPIYPSHVSSRHDTSKQRMVTMTRAVEMRAQLPFDLSPSSYQYSSIHTEGAEHEESDGGLTTFPTKNATSSDVRTNSSVKSMIRAAYSKVFLAALLLTLIVVFFTAAVLDRTRNGLLERKKPASFGYKSGDRVFVKIIAVSGDEPENSSINTKKASDFSYIRVGINGHLVTDKTRYLHGGLFQLLDEGASDSPNMDTVWRVLSVATGQSLYVDGGALAGGASAMKTTDAQLVMRRPSIEAQVAFAHAEGVGSTMLQWYVDDEIVCVDELTGGIVVGGSVDCLVVVEPYEPIRGVNIGSWMIPELWLSPEPYKGLDPYYGQPCGLVKEVGIEEADRRMYEHLFSWLTEEDFDRIDAYGFNSVRIPVGYWNIIPDPYRMFAPSDVQVSLERLDWAFDMAQERGLSVLLDLHGLPGSQNALEHSGCGYNGILWHEGANRNLSLTTIAAIVDRYISYSNFLGIEIINEPSEVEDIVHRRELSEYYSEAYSIIRASSDDLLVVISELWSNQYDSWSYFFDEKYFHNVVMDWHLYNWDDEEGEDDHFKRAETWRQFVQTFITKYPMVIGEWSISESMKASKGGQEYLSAQLAAFTQTYGWYYWNFRAPERWCVWSVECLIGERQYSFGLNEKKGKKKGKK